MSTKYEPRCSLFTVEFDLKGLDAQYNSELETAFDELEEQLENAVREFADMYNLEWEKS